MFFGISKRLIVSNERKKSMNVRDILTEYYEKT